ncbi:MAG: hypothetical protein ACHQVK_04930, partial [Candidatus Paceibacterales bacterium]
MSSKFKSSLIFLVISMVFMLPLKLGAVAPTAISVDIAPLNPSPGEDTTITLGSYTNNLDNILISWFVNGKKVSSVIGEKAFSVKAPSATTTTTVKAVMAFPDGAVEKNINIKSSVTILLYEAMDSYVPPFYRGKAMPTIG